MAGVRKIVVPGISLDVSVLLTDVAKNAVLAISYNGDVIVVFSDRQGNFSARAMTTDQARHFSNQLLAAHQAISDDDKIAQMEKHLKGETDDNR